MPIETINNVAYYRCQYENFTKTVQEALIFISSDHTHDAAAVMKFTSIANHHLTMTRGINIE